MLSENEIKARDCLRAGSFLVDPRMQSDHHGMMEKLKTQCRACWHLRQWWPDWVTELAKGWAAEKLKDSSE